MPQYTLHYFNVSGRGQLARLLFAAAGVEFTDHRIDFKDWGEVEKKKTDRYPFSVAPTLEIDGKILPESIAIARYLANEFGLNGKDNWEKAWCDVFVESLQELRRDSTPFMPMFVKEKDEAKLAQMKKEFFEGKFAKRMEVLEGLFKANNEGKGYLAGDKLTWADLTLLDHSELFTSLYPTCLDATPLLKSLNSRVRELPKIKAFLDARPPKA